MISRASMHDEQLRFASIFAKNQQRRSRGRFRRSPKFCQKTFNPYEQTVTTGARKVERRPRQRKPVDSKKISALAMSSRTPVRRRHPDAEDQHAAQEGQEGLKVRLRGASSGPSRARGVDRDLRRVRSEGGGAASLPVAGGAHPRNPGCGECHLRRHRGVLRPRAEPHADGLVPQGEAP